jgi:hypothetical protein
VKRRPYETPTVDVSPTVWVVVKKLEFYRQNPHARRRDSVADYVADYVADHVERGAASVSMS